MSRSTGPALPGPGPVDPAGAAALLRDARGQVLVAGHVRPDADAAGSAIALATALRRAGTDAVVSFGGPDPMPASLRVLDPDGVVVAPDRAPAAPDLLVCCDISSVSRLGELASRLPAVRTSLAVDHHASFDPFTVHHLVDPGAPATVLLVRAILAELGTGLDPVLARALFAGLYTDTGGFRWGGAAALRLGAELVEAGAEPRELMREISGTSPFAWLAAQATVLAGARREPDGAGGRPLVWAVVDVATATRFRDQTVTLVGRLLATAGDGVAALLTEVAQDSWSVSLRGTGTPDLSRVAATLGGGGHAAAAGFERDGTRDGLLGLLRAELAAQP